MTEEKKDQSMPTFAEFASYIETTNPEAVHSFRMGAQSVFPILKRILKAGFESDEKALIQVVKEIKR